MTNLELVRIKRRQVDIKIKKAESELFELRDALHQYDKQIAAMLNENKDSIKGMPLK